MNKIVLSAFALTLGFASPVLASETTQNGLQVMKLSIEARSAVSAPLGYDAMTQGAMVDRTAISQTKDAARGAYSGT